MLLIEALIVVRPNIGKLGQRSNRIAPFIF